MPTNLPQSLHEEGIGPLRLWISRRPAPRRRLVNAAKDADEHTLHVHVRVVHRLVGLIGWLQANPTGLAEELLQGDFVLFDLGDHDVAIGESGSAPSCSASMYSAPVWVSMWARIGLKVNLNAMPRATYFAKIQKFDTSAYLLGWGVATFDAQYTLQSCVLLSLTAA